MHPLQEAKGNVILLYIGCKEDRNSDPRFSFCIFSVASPHRTPNLVPTLILVPADEMRLPEN
jgi:hypothetical protein